MGWLSLRDDMPDKKNIKVLMQLGENQTYCHKWKLEVCRIGITSQGDISSSTLQS